MLGLILVEKHLCRIQYDKSNGFDYEVIMRLILMLAGCEVSLSRWPMVKLVEHICTFYQQSKAAIFRKPFS